jgi:uncharacterized protein (TIGR03085 family)
MSTPATRERHRFADELSAVGPDVATLCEGWTARDLAAHVVLRDRRPDAAAGVIVGALSGYTEKVQRGIADQEWAELVQLVREPPVWSPARIDKVDRVINTTEFFVHLEDLRRAQPDWQPRDLDTDLVDDLRSAFGRVAKTFTRKAPVGVTYVPDGGTPIVAKDAEPMVTVSGPVPELVLFVFGRQAHARVDLAGPEVAIEQLRTASFGI